MKNTWVILSILFASVCWGANPGHVEQLKKTKMCLSCDLEGADLSGLDLSGCNVSLANLSRANLSKTNLSDSTMVKANDGPGRLSLVGGDDPVIEVEIFGLKQIQLQGSLFSYGLELAHEDDSIHIVPAFRLPFGFEVGPLGVDAIPALAFFDQSLELREALEWHRARKLNVMLRKHRKYGVVEERAVGT